MKLAKASQQEIDTLMTWLQDLESAKYEDAKHRPPAFMRVVFGYETLVNNVCDPEKDYLEYKPGYAPAEVDALRTRNAELEAAVRDLLVNNVGDFVYSIRESEERVKAWGAACAELTRLCPLPKTT